MLKGSEEGGEKRKKKGNCLTAGTLVLREPKRKDMVDHLEAEMSRSPWEL